MGERMQADGGAHVSRQDDGVAVTPGRGESGGGARPGKEGHGDGGEAAGFTGHGGQSNISYHGPEQLGDESIAESQPNAATR